MNTAVINIRTNARVKSQAQKIAADLGMSLSGLINGFIKQLIRTKRVEFDLDENPSKYLIESLKQSEKEFKEGKTSPAFDNVDDAISWLNHKELLKR